MVNEAWVTASVCNESWADVAQYVVKSGAAGTCVGCFVVVMLALVCCSVG